MCLNTEFFHANAPMAPSSTKELHQIPTITFIFLLVVFLGICNPFGADARTDNDNTVRSECLKVSPSEFVGSVREVVDILQDVTSILSEFGNAFGDFRLSNAVSDCLDLLDLSSDELSWSASATESPKGTIHSLCLFPLSHCVWHFMCKQTQPQ